MRNALQQCGHVGVVRVVRGDGPHQPQRIKHGQQHLRDRWHRTARYGAKMALQCAQDLVIVPGVLIQLHNQPMSWMMPNLDRHQAYSAEGRQQHLLNCRHQAARYSAEVALQHAQNLVLIPGVLIQLHNRQQDSDEVVSVM